MQGLSLETGSSANGPVKEERPVSPSKLPKPVTSQVSFPYVPSTPPKSPTKTPKSKKRFPLQPFLTRDSHTKAWNPEEKIESIERMYAEMHEKFSATANNRDLLQETLGVYKANSTSFHEIRRAIQEIMATQSAFPKQNTKLTHLLVILVSELEKHRAELTETNANLRVEVQITKDRLATTERNLNEVTTEHEIDIDDLKRNHRIEVENIRQESRQEVDRVYATHREEVRELKLRFESEVENERSQRIQAVNNMSTQGALETQRQQLEIGNKDREIRAIKGEVEQVSASLERERLLNQELRQTLSVTQNNNVNLESSLQALRGKIEFLESDNKSQSEAYADMERRMREAIERSEELHEKLRREETLRRKLHNQVQELKGNIRVFCRVRPPLEIDESEQSARISIPDEETDSKEIEVLGPDERSSLGTITTKTYPFSFDRVFGPTSQNQHVFEEISQLIQSALDGYNVCIFCYGQTGSGKTYTMSSEDGMIPRAVHQIYNTAQSLEERGWRYTMEGQFVEVYNENLNDLLGKAEDFDKKKHDIRHDMKECKTTITDVTSVALDSPEKVESILRKAANNRSVAATKANERSSRSHSVFILMLKGENSITGERSEGTLNLVDLAGSERLAQSKATGDRLKETQNINKSLSSLGDVIGALGNGKEGAHVPYRNSKVSVSAWQVTVKRLPRPY